MLTRVDVESENAFYVPVLGVTPKDSLLIKKITGLNPPDIDLFIGDYSRDGGLYQGRRVGKRNIVITIELNPNPALGETVSGLREMLYKAFVDPLVDADYVKLNFHDDVGRIRYIVGYVEKFETDLFDVETMVQISMICPDPYIRDVYERVEEEPSGQGWSVVPFTYNGTAEMGFEAEIAITASISKLTIDNNSITDDPNDLVSDYNRGRMIITRQFQMGDVVNLVTIRGRRSLTVTSSGVTKSIVGNLSPYSKWLELHSQSNELKVYGELPGTGGAAVKKLSFVQAYWGL